MLGIATAAIFLSALPEKSGAFSLVLICAILFLKANSARTHAAPCAIKVAHATPATPHLKTATNNKSRMILPTEEPIRKYKGVLESPSELNIPVVILYKNKKTNPPI